MRIGGDKVIPVDVRIISATNKDLKKLTRKGNFREDLYYRLDVLQIKLPPLRERREDIKPLVDHFLKKHGVYYGKCNIQITENAIKFLEVMELCGNIRELANICEKLVVLSDTDRLDEEVIQRILNFESNTFKISPNKEEYNEFPSEYDDKLIGVGRLNKETIENALRKMKYNKVKTAKYLGISRSTLYSYINELEIIL
jgi:transcriptional regulator with PAS, ATPase and Fis domain